MFRHLPFPIRLAVAFHILLACQSPMERYVPPVPADPLTMGRAA